MVNKKQYTVDLKEMDRQALIEFIAFLEGFEASGRCRVPNLDTLRLMMNRLKEKQ